ncbi:hypothetical protein ACE0DR_25770 [Azotobacter sp. CWF10]
MPTEAAPVRRLARRSLRVHALLIGVVVLATLQAGLLLSAGSQPLNEERSKIEHHFRRLDGTLREQERFPRQWRLHDVGVRGQPCRCQRGTATRSAYANFAVIGTEGLVVRHRPSWATGSCASTASFWSASRYPPPQCLLVDGQAHAGCWHRYRSSVPMRARTARITCARRSPTSTAHWVRGPRCSAAASPRKRAVARPADLAASPSPTPRRMRARGVRTGKDSQAALACLLDPARVDDYRQVLAFRCSNGCRCSMPMASACWAMLQ